MRLIKLVAPAITREIRALFQITCALNEETTSTLHRRPHRPRRRFGIVAMGGDEMQADGRAPGLAIPTPTIGEHGNSCREASRTSPAHRAVRPGLRCDCATRRHDACAREHGSSERIAPKGCTERAGIKQKHPAVAGCFRKGHRVGHPSPAPKHFDPISVPVVQPLGLRIAVVVCHSDANELLVISAIMPSTPQQSDRGGRP